MYQEDLSADRQVLEHLNLWEQKLSRDPLEWELLYEDNGVVRELFDGLKNQKTLPDRRFFC